ncbi:TVP38/TMEM64 family protein [Spirilliplanes yamanashiensis]|nr:VTT domain-containing protein [Spirilliplanes yamanashiensis]MDP9816947.1 putative membrane protein YdjX (TVP38/TMEM64 family) [Spirilliplanes yamanashiensis]
MRDAQHTRRPAVASPAGHAVAVRCPRTGVLLAAHPATGRAVGRRPHAEFTRDHGHHFPVARVVPLDAPATPAPTAAPPAPHVPPHTAPEPALTTIDLAPAALAPTSARAGLPTDSPTRRRLSPAARRRLVRGGTLVLVVGALGALAAVLPIRELLHDVRALGPAAAVGVAVIGGLLLSVLVPRTAITIACGMLLGPAVGAVAALAAAMIAAAATYFAGRWAGHGALRARAGGRLDRLDGWLNRRGLSAVLLVRFLPLAPFGLIGYAYGTTSVCRKNYLLGTLLAAVPSAVTYAVIGAAVTAPGEMNPATLAPAAIGFTLTTTIVWRWRRAARRAAAAAA